MSKSSRKQNLPRKTSSQNKSAQMTQVAASFSGPIPPPSLLQGYESIQPGFAERIVKMAEEESSHRKGQERKELDADIRFGHRDFTERRIGQILAFLIVIIMAGLGSYLAMNGKEIVGSVFGGPAIVSIVLAFLKKNNQAKH